MRISDWSSDVCSSDLGATHQRHREEPRLSLVVELVVIVLDDRRRLGQQRDQRVEDVSGTAAVQRADRVRLAEAQRHGLPDEAFAAGVVDLVGDEDDIALGQVARSEEHTSELKSLMRISFAELCLKLKTSLPSIKLITYT